MSLDIDVGPWVGCHPVRAELPHDGDSNLGLDRDLVTNADTLQWWWALKWTIVPDEAGEHLPKSRG